MNGYANTATFDFVATVENDQDIYYEILKFCRQMIWQDQSDQTLGRNIIDRVFAWKEGGGFGYPDARPRFTRVTESWTFGPREVNESEVGESFREVLEDEPQW